MARNPLLEAVIDVDGAIQALRLRRHRLVSTPDGIEIHQPGKPVLLLTHGAARDFAHEMEEAEQ